MEHNDLGSRVRIIVSSLTFLFLVNIALSEKTVLSSIKKEFYSQCFSEILKKISEKVGEEKDGSISEIFKLEHFF